MRASHPHNNTGNKLEVTYLFITPGEASRFENECNNYDIQTERLEYRPIEPTWQASHAFSDFWLKTHPVPQKFMPNPDEND